MTPDLEVLAQQWLSELREELPGAIELRHRLHADPRLSGDECDTVAAVAQAIGIEFETVAGCGGWARIGPGEGDAVAVRGELDALPGTERTGASFAASEGAVHACGHDVHLAALTALARAAARVNLPAGLVLLLQPREEKYPSGAEDIARAGVLTAQGVRVVVGAHVHHDVPRGHVAAGAGPVNAASDELHITVRGTGGHGAYPHRAADPVAALAQIALGLPEMVRRTVSPMDPAVISVGSLHIGHGAANVLPSEGVLLATLRTMGREDRRLVQEAVRVLVESTARAYGVSGELTVVAGEPVLENDPDVVEASERWLTEFGLGIAVPMRSLGSDDFSFYGEQAATLMSFVGVYERPGHGLPTLHDMEFLPPDDVVEDVARSMMAGYLGAVDVLAARRSAE